MEPRVRSHPELHYDYGILTVHEYLDPYTGVCHKPNNYGENMDMTMTWTICHNLNLVVPTSEKIVEEEKFQYN